MARRVSPQQLDPLSGVTAQAFAWVFTIAAYATSAGLTVIHRDEYRDPVLLAAALAALVLAGAVVVLASSPRRAPFSWRSAAAIHLLCLAAVGLEQAAQWGHNLTVRSDWAPIAFALLVMATGCFRPALEILLMTSVSVAGVAVATIAGASAADAVLPSAVYAALTAGPLLAAAAGAAAFSATLVARLRRWREQTAGRRLAAVERMRARVREDLRAERLLLVEHEAGPFLRELVARGETDAATAARARELGEALRRALVDEADDVWLGDLVTSLDDPAGLATGMDETERAAIEAACASLDGRRLHATLRRVDDRCRLTLGWDRGGAGRLGPEIQAMLRAVFPGAQVQPRVRRVEVEFDGE